MIPGRLEATFGGGELNVAVTVALQGGEASYLTALPDNALTDCLMQECCKLGVGTELIRRVQSGRFGIYFVETGANQRGGTIITTDGAVRRTRKHPRVARSLARRDSTWLPFRRIVNPRIRFEKIIKRAGVTPWPRLWHNLRSSRQTELTESFPAHVVSMWLGNSERIAAQHYLHVLESHFQKATQKATQHTAASGVFEAHAVITKARTLGNPRVHTYSVGDEGLEPATSTV